jgi:hydrogenase expression/formation protein HypD
MLRVPGTSVSLADSRALTGGPGQPGRVHVVYSIDQAAELARKTRNELVFFATGFETTAVTTAAAIVSGLPPNMSVLSAHKYIPPAMDIVARTPGTRIEGFLAAGHAATITGWGLFRDFARRHRVPVVIAGFEPLDILAALVKLLGLIRDRDPVVANLYPRCVTKRGNRPAQLLLWRVFKPQEGRWRGIAPIPNGNLRLRDEWAYVDARRRFRIPETQVEPDRPSACICGQIMTGLASPTDCPLYATDCAPATPIGACMVSTEGACRIWHEYGSRPAALGGAP